MHIINFKCLIMKKMFFKSLSIALSLVAMVFSSCSKEQSFLDIQDIPGKAKIIGNFSYDAGQGYSGGMYTQLIKPVADVKVFVKVSNQSLSPNGEAKGYTYYETVTDLNGNYEVEIPAVDSGTSVIVTAESFMGTYSTVEAVSNNTPVFNSKEVQYKFTSKNLTVNPYDVVICDGNYSCNERNILEAYEYNSTFIIKVGEGVYAKIIDDNDKVVIKKYHNLVSGKNVIATIDGVNYGATTNSNGEAKFIIPSESKKWNTTANISVEGYVTNNYSYFERGDYDYETGTYKYEKQTIKGIFQQLDNSVSLSFTGINGEQTVAKVRMIFTPFEEEETYGYSKSDWSSYPWTEYDSSN